MTKKHLAGRLCRFIRATKAVSALEYAILVGVIAVAIAAALATFSGSITTALNNIGADIAATTGAGTPATG